MEPDREPRRGIWFAAKFVMWPIAVVGGVFLMFVIDSGLQDSADNGDELWTWVGLAIVAAFPLAVLGLLYAEDRISSNHAQTALVITAIVVGLQAYGTYTHVDRNEQLVSDYCEYGSTSAAQLRACEDHVDPDAVRHSDTAAAEYARGEPGCGSTAGPYCDFSEAEKQEALDAGP